MKAKIGSIFWLLLVAHVAGARGQIFCHEDFTNDQIIELSCSGKNLNDGNYWDTLNTTFFETQLSIRAKNSVDYRNVALYVENNRIESLKVLPFMPTVAVLSFKNNRLVSGAEGTFHRLPDLKHLDLSHNLFRSESVTKYMFKGKQNEALELEHLNLAYNFISHLQEDVFLYLPNLISLDLGYNHFNFLTQETMSAISQLSKLQVLSLAHTQLSYIPDVFFSKITLRSLYLNGNHFAEMPKSLRHLGNHLEYLNLNDNPIHEIDSQSLVGLSNLRELHLNVMDALTSIGEDAFSPLVSLSILRCSFNPSLSVIHPKAFFGLKKNWNLKEIFLDDNNLPFLAEETFELEKVNILSVRGNPWNCTCSLKWLYQYIKEREKHDPEANIGIRCKYPQKLFKRWLLNVEKVLKCNETQETHSSHHFIRSTFVFIFIIVLILFFLFVALYFCLLETRQKLYTIDRQLGSHISTTTKYRRAELRDNDGILDTSEND